MKIEILERPINNITMEENILLIDEKYMDTISASDEQEFQDIVTDFLDCYQQNKDKPYSVWLPQILQEKLPGKCVDEINEISDDIISNVEIFDAKHNSLNESMLKGQSKEGWLVNDIRKATSAYSLNETASYLSELDSAMAEANANLYDVLLTKEGVISRNPSLDGYIAEEWHAQTFNLNAEANGSIYRAKALKPQDGIYGKNSVDIVIEDIKTGKVVKRYQSKYCKDSDATLKAFEEGDYRGQQKLVPDDQYNEIKKKCTNVLEAPDGTKSTPLSKTNAQRLRDEAQSGNWKEFNWDKYATKDLVKGIGKQARNAALLSAAVSALIQLSHIGYKKYKGKKVEAKDFIEVAEVAFKSGADSGVKVALAGALKVGVEKNIIKGIPKGKSANVYAAIAFTAVENVKIGYEMYKGKLTMQEGLEKMERVTLSCVTGFAASEIGKVKGAAVGACVGAIFGPHGIVVGAKIGSFVGSIFAFLVAEKTVDYAVKQYQDMRKTVLSVIKTKFQSQKKTTFATGIV